MFPRRWLSLRGVPLGAGRGVVGLVLVACATLPELPGGEDGLPHAGAGPFRALRTPEIGNNHVGPQVLADGRGYARDIAVMDRDGDPATLEVIGFVAAAAKENGEEPTRDTPPRSIVRYRAVDGRSFDRSAEVVLTADAAWEGGQMAAPAVVRSAGGWWLYYASAGGIGLARGSDDGASFAKVPGPVLGAAAGGWDAGAVPRSPGVMRLDDGSYRMFYEASQPSGSSAIGEARSRDGITWTRVGDTPALEPSGESSDTRYDAGGVGGPFPVMAVSAEGRAILRVYYGAVDASGNKTIGLAARYGTEGPLKRGIAPVFGTRQELGPSEPCVVGMPGFVLLFVTQASGTISKDPVIAAGVTPVTAVLPPAVQ